MTSSTIKNRARRLLENKPAVYRTVSAAYRSLEVLQGMAYVAERAPRIMMGARPIVVDYASIPRPRWGHGRPGHERLTVVIEQNRREYEALLRSFGECRRAMEAVPESSPPDSGEPSWNNSFFKGIDAVSQYGLLATLRPKRYFEIGSGFSTRLARRAIRDQGLATSLLSIDPSPQSSIDALCDIVMRQPLEDIDLSLFDQLESGDILFFDGSHHAFMNSDVVVFFLEILPRLRPGVAVHVHDIFLPYDYPPDWVEFFYSEQYLLAMALMARTPSLEVLFPAQFIVQDQALSALMREQIGPRALGGGASFWFRTR